MMKETLVKKAADILKMKPADLTLKTTNCYAGGSTYMLCRPGHYGSLYQFTMRTGVFACGVAFVGSIQGQRELDDLMDEYIRCSQVMPNSLLLYYNKTNDHQITVRKRNGWILLREFGNKLYPENPRRLSLMAYDADFQKRKDRADYKAFEAARNADTPAKQAIAKIAELDARHFGGGLAAFHRARDIARAVEGK